MSLAGPAEAELRYTLGDHGLASLSLDGQSLLVSSYAGSIRPVNGTPKVKNADGAVANPLDQPKSALEPQRQRIRQDYSWGTIVCSYSHSGNVLRLDVQVTNTSLRNSIEALELRLGGLTFPDIPLGRTLEPGMWGKGGNPIPLHRLSQIARPGRVPPVIFVHFEGGTLAYVNEADPGSLGNVTINIPFTTDPDTKRTYPFQISFPPIPPGVSASANVSLRFAGAGADVQALAGDVLQRFREAYPYVLKWSDRRPIGALFLATSQQHTPTNPRGWFFNARDIDTTTPEGLAKWRAKLMQYADQSIKALQDLDAQGMITWDAEGEEFPSAVYYGDPRLTSRLAPETDFAGSGRIGALDEYFQKFRSAGLRTGITLRPQVIEFKDGKPFQKYVEDPTRELLERIAYARKRWGCTLFYVDSTVDKDGALPPDIFKTVAEAHPDVLLMPENESFRYFAYSAPLNSFEHHDVTSTPASVREVYSQAFSTLLATTNAAKRQAGRDALVEGVRRGDILIVNAWFSGSHTEFIKSIYREATNKGLAR